MLPPRARGPLLILALVGLAVFAAFRIDETATPERRGLESRPPRVMGTSCRLIAVPRAPDGAPQATAALAAAEAALRHAEAQMSRHIAASALSRLNRAPPRVAVSVPPALLALLQTSRSLHEQTRGAFDVTCGPLVELWKRAAQRGEPPSSAEVTAARRASRWQAVSSSETTVTKQDATVRFDLGGIAKGHGIDRAVQAMRAAGVSGGLVDVGGDLRVFGRPPAGSAWEVRIRGPLGGDPIATIALEQGAVCTSGGYFRYFEIGGRRYSHILDPRTGQPASRVASATVLARDATRADGWATALSVLGRRGLARLPVGVEAMLVVGTPEAPRAVVTRGLQALLVDGPPYPLQVVGPN
jgi:thiamine biosynthesis lipoprotein